MRKKVRYAVVGLGHIAQKAVLPAFKHPGISSELTALVSGSPGKLSQLSKMYRVKHLYSYDRYLACLDSGDIDAVYIALPNHLHQRYATEALRRGIHVLCEKPLALTAAECRSIIRAADEGGAKLMVAYRLHFDPVNLNVVNLARSGRLGTPRIFNSIFSQQVRAGDTRLKAKVGGGPLHDIGIYCINAARYLFQAEPCEVMAMGAASKDRRFRQVDEMVGALLRFPGDRLASFVCSFGASDRADLDIVGTKGSVHLESAYEYSVGMKAVTRANGRTRTTDYPVHDQFAPQLRYFSRCILRKRNPEPSGREGLIDVEIIEALQRSARTGRSVEMNIPLKKTRPSLKQAKQMAKPRVPAQILVTSPTR